MAAINTIQYLYCPLRYMCADQFGDTLNLFLDSMNFRLTKTLESIIARAAFDAEKNNFANGIFMAHVMKIKTEVVQDGHAGH